jgi:hypothetical protein
MTTALFSKNMPQKSLTSDNQTSFVLGRRAFFNKTYLSHKTENLSKNLDYSDRQISKPLENKSSDLRTQRLRLATIGSGSSKLKDSNDQVSFVKKNGDVNYVNNVLSRVRGGSSVAPKKRNLQFKPTN